MDGRMICTAPILVPLPSSLVETCPHLPLDRATVKTAKDGFCVYCVKIVIKISPGGDTPTPKQHSSNVKRGIVSRWRFHRLLHAALPPLPCARLRLPRLLPLALPWALRPWRAPPEERRSETVIENGFKKQNKNNNKNLWRHDARGAFQGVFRKTQVSGEKTMEQGTPQN